MRYRIQCIPFASHQTALLSPSALFFNYYSNSDSIQWSLLVRNLCSFEQSSYSLAWLIDSFNESIQKMGFVIKWLHSLITSFFIPQSAILSSDCVCDICTSSWYSAIKYAGKVVTHHSVSTDDEMMK